MSGDVFTLIRVSREKNNRVRLHGYLSGGVFLNLLAPKGSDVSALLSWYDSLESSVADRYLADSAPGSVIRVLNLSVHLTASKLLLHFEVVGNPVTMSYSSFMVAYFKSLHGSATKVNTYKLRSYSKPYRSAPVDLRVESHTGAVSLLRLRTEKPAWVSYVRSSVGGFLTVAEGLSGEVIDVAVYGKGA